MESFQREIFEKSVDITLTKVIDTWLRTDSYPIVTVSVDGRRNEIFISQEQLVPQNVSSVQRPFTLPVNIHNAMHDVSSDGTFFVISSTVVTRASNYIGNNSWLLLNTHGLGECVCASDEHE